MSIYCKITNESEFHEGIQYVTGLNVSNKNECNLIFIKISDVDKFFNFGRYIRIVYLPSDDPNFKMESHGEFAEKANMIILGERMSLLDVVTYRTLDINIQHNIVNIINIASKEGYIDVLNRLKTHNVKLMYNECAINHASSNGHIKILNWWKDQVGFKLKYTNLAINNASSKGQISVLNWWINSGLKLKYDKWAIIGASFYGNVEVLEWWLEANKRGHKFKYNQAAITLASRNGQLDVLCWWKKICKGGCIPFKYDCWAGIEAATYGRLDILDWWLLSGYEMKYDKRAIIGCCSNGHISVLDWFVEHLGIEFVKSCYSTSIITAAKKDNYLCVIKWWSRLNVENC